RASDPRYPSTDPPQPEPPMIRPHHQILLFGLLVAAACGGAAPRGELPPPAPTLAPSDTACLIAAGRPASRDTVTIALTDPIDPAHAPLPRNVAERFVFAQLYETLIRVDCRGRVLPALARSWEQGPEGRWPEALRASPVPGAGLPALKVTVAPASEARDAVDANADLLLTSDPAALDYGRTRSEYQDAPLGWDQTYVLLAPDGSSLELSALRLETLPQAVHVEARPAQADDGGFWLVDLKRCGLAAEAPSTHAPPRRRIVYEQADRDARDLAARLVGLAALGRGAVVAGLAPAAFEPAFRSGAEAAYVLRVRRRTVDPCAAARELPAWVPRGSITPLIDTRTHALVRRGLPRLSVD